VQGWDHGESQPAQRPRAPVSAEQLSATQDAALAQLPESTRAFCEAKGRPRRRWRAPSAGQLIPIPQICQFYPTLSFRPRTRSQAANLAK
jgi:hypothetical protein